MENKKIKWFNFYCSVCKKELNKKMYAYGYVVGDKNANYSICKDCYKNTMPSMKIRKKSRTIKGVSWRK